MGGGNSITIGKYVKMKDCHFIINGNNCKIIIEESCRLSGLGIWITGNGSQVHIKKNVTVNALSNRPTCFNAVDGKSIIIGENCLLSNNIEIHTSDYHDIIENDTSLKINNPADVVIENHVWIGIKAIILKGSHILADSIVGAGSIVSGKFENTNIILAGVPAREIKQNVNWKQ